MKDSGQATRPTYLQACALVERTQMDHVAKICRLRCLRALCRAAVKKRRTVQLSSACRTFARKEFRAMKQRIASVSLLVRDYDEAIAYYTGVLGFSLVEDTPLSPGKRWVLVCPQGGADGACLLLARAATPAQAGQIGNQTGGRVFLFLHTDDFWRDYERFHARGVMFVEQPRQEEYGTVVVFTDLYGNRWDLVEPKRRQEPLERNA